MAPVGVVVVGVGRAGGARVRDLGKASNYEQTKHVKLIGYVSREKEAHPGPAFSIINSQQEDVCEQLRQFFYINYKTNKLELEFGKQITLEEALSNDDVHIIIIATENKTHYDLAKKCIAAGKHVVVEFPLGINADQVSELQKIAKEKGVLCHEEVISMLLDSHNKMKELVKSKPPLKEASINFTASYNGWIEDFEGSGSPFTSGISNLHDMYDLFGEFEPVSASLEMDDDHFVCSGTFQTKDKKPITFTTTRTKASAQRSSVKKFIFTDGSESAGVQPTFAKEGPGLFMLDFIQFLEKMENGSQVLPSPEATLHCHQVADALYKMAKNTA